MREVIGLTPATMLALPLVLAITLTGRPAHAQFSAREGFTADGTAHWSLEFAPYVYLPNLSANIGLAHPPGFDVSINRGRPTIAQLVTSLTGAFVGYTVARYGNWSAELNVLYVGLEAKKSFPPLLSGRAVPLPAKCPELNPQENIWQFMRDNWLSNRIFAGYDNLVDHCCSAWNKLVVQPWTIMSIGLRDWAHGF